MISQGRKHQRYVNRTATGWGRHRQTMLLQNSCSLGKGDRTNKILMSV
jgi:hypothetical protein